MVRPLVLTVVLLCAVVTIRSVGGDQQKEERQCGCQAETDRKWIHCERVIDIDNKSNICRADNQSNAHFPLHVSISMQDSVLFVSKRPFVLVRFVNARPNELPKVDVLPNPFAREVPIKATRGWDGLYRVSTGPVRDCHPPAVLEHLKDEKMGITYDAILEDENGKAIDPHIEIIK